MTKRKRPKSPHAKPAAPSLKHCDEYIDDESAPLVLRQFLQRARSPAHGMLQSTMFPTLFADYQGSRVRVVMASRFGHVGITKNLAADFNYETTVPVSELSNFGEFPRRWPPEPDA